MTTTTETGPKVVTKEQELYRQLTRPLWSRDIEWRVQRSGVHERSGIWATLTPYVTARGVQRRLDAVFGPMGWQVKHEALVLPTPGVLTSIGCYHSSFPGNGWIWKSDGAPQTDIEEVKGGLSAAFKRAAVQWGIGRWLYDLDEVYAEILSVAPEREEKHLWTKARAKRNKEDKVGVDFWWRVKAIDLQKATKNGEESEVQHLRIRLAEVEAQLAKAHEELDPVKLQLRRA